MGSKPVECTVIWCANRFDTFKEMQRHKVNEPDHFYCKRCNVDCVDWEDLTNHKVESMAPFIEGNVKGNEDGSLKHIVCEFCGMDFKSWGGRRRHREQAHQASQEVECPGCQMRFARASHFIRHLEFGECSSINLFYFQGNVQHKHMVKQLMKDPEGFEQKMLKGRLAQTTSDAPDLLITDGPTRQSPNTTNTGTRAKTAGQVTDGSEAADQDDGGVPLLIDLGTPPTRHTTEAWPRLPSQNPSQLTDSMSTLSLNTAAHPPSINITSPSGKQSFDQAYPPLGPSPLPPHKPSQAPKDPNPSSGSWATSSPPSSLLFPHSKKTPPSLETIRLLEARDASADASAVSAANTTNALRSRLLDPQSADYRPDLFAAAEGGVGGYICPFPNCDVVFAAAADVAEHIADDHSRTSFACPYCRKNFAFATSLIAHAESVGRCRVRETKAFNRLLDEVSGGFLASRGVKAPKLYRKEKGAVVVRDGGRREGVMDTKFCSTASKW